MAKVGKAHEPQRPSWRRSPSLVQGPAARFLFELLLILPAYFSYHLVRGAVSGRAEAAFSNADRIIDLERSLGIFWEVQLQGLILGHQPLIDFFNGVYIWGHIPVVGALAIWIFAFRRDAFARYRNAFLISGAIGLVVFVTVPVAPPRFIFEAGFVDTVTQHSEAYRVLQPPAFVNQYAAMPSLHFGWNLLVGVALFETTRPWQMRAFGLIMPLFALAGIVLTGNHYILDAVAGGAVAMASLWFAGLVHRRLSGLSVPAFLI